MRDTTPTTRRSSVPMVGRVWGTGEPRFVLLHGLGVASRMVAPLGIRLARHGTVVAPDLPGFGAAADQGALDLHGHAELVASRFLKALPHRYPMPPPLTVDDLRSFLAGAGPYEGVEVHEEPARVG